MCAKSNTSYAASPMNRRVDELLVKISGRATLRQQLEIDQDVRLVIEGQVVKVETLSNQDGSVNLCYVVKPTKVDVILP